MIISVEVICICFVLLIQMVAMEDLKAAGKKNIFICKSFENLFKYNFVHLCKKSCPYNMYQPSSNTVCGSKLFANNLFIVQQKKFNQKIYKSNEIGLW